MSILWTAEEIAVAERLYAAGRPIEEILEAITAASQSAAARSIKARPAVVRTEKGLRHLLSKKALWRTVKVDRRTADKSVAVAPRPPVFQPCGDAEIIRLAKLGVRVTHIAAQLRQPYRRVAEVLDGRE